MKLNFKKSIIAVGIGLFLAGSAQADLIIDDGSTPSSKPVVTSTTLSNVNYTPNVDTSIVSQNTNSTLNLKNVKLSGVYNNSDFQTVYGFGKDLPLMTVLKQVVPNGWKAKKIGSVDLNKKVSWRGDRSWVEILDNLAIDNDFSVNLDMSSRTLTITPFNSSSSTSVSVKTTGVNPFSNSSSSNSNNFSNITKNSGSSQLNSAISTAPVYTSSTWLLSKDKTLKENIQDWAKQAGWVVSWEAPDYRIVADVTLTGKIDANDGPIARVIAAYKNAEQPLSAQLSEGNKVIRIQSRNYQQETVVNQDMNDTFPDYASRY